MCECSLTQDTATMLHSAGDIEGHLGVDDQFYLIDFSRTMPPEKPKREYLYSV